MSLFFSPFAIFRAARSKSSLFTNVEMQPAEFGGGKGRAGPCLPQFISSLFCSKCLECFRLSLLSKVADRAVLLFCQGREIKIKIKNNNHQCDSESRETVQQKEGPGTSSAATLCESRGFCNILNIKYSLRYSDEV